MDENVSTISKISFSNEILNFNEVRCLLSVSKSTLYKLTSSNSIPHYKPTGGKLFFKRTEIINWISQKDISTETNEDVLLKIKDVNDDK